MFSCSRLGDSFWRGNRISDLIMDVFAALLTLNVVIDVLAKGPGLPAVAGPFPK